MKKIMLSLPNWLTLTRLVMIPILVFVFYLPFEFTKIVAAILFGLACFTDWLDGFLARKLEQSSSFGAFLDPVADKLLVSTSLLLLVGPRHIAYITLPSIIIVGREIVISALREWMAEMGQRVSVAVSYIGKIKTGVQMLAIFLLLAFAPSESWWGMSGVLLLYVAAGLTIWSMIVYLTIAWPELTRR
jgi:CDP-diacylglycerol--glycerol-3-phosphate 3-phosphatidyltransferase